MIRWIVFLAALLLIAWGDWADLSSHIASYWTSGATKDEIERAGQWGDSFGAFNALVSSFAFAAVIATVMIQSKALKDQASDLHRQRFESSFLELLQLARELRKEVIFSHSSDYVDAQIAGKSSLSRLAFSGTRENIAAFRSITLEIIFWLRKEGVSEYPTQDHITNIYMRRIHSKSEATLGRYFRIIYTILYRIYKDKVLTEEEKFNYSNLLRSQLTSYEITLLAANGLAPVSKDLMKYIIHFRMLKYMTGAANRKRFENLYGEIAFTARD